jgi:hypothetical protein
LRGRVGAATPCWRLENSAAESFGGTCSSRTGFDAVAMVVASDAPAALVAWASPSRSTHWYYIHRRRRRRERRAACPSAHRRRVALLEDADAQCACHEPMRLDHQAASQRAELSIHGHGVYSRRSASRHLRMFGVRAIVGRHYGRQTIQASFKSYLINRARCARWPRLELRCSTARRGCHPVAGECVAGRQQGEQTKVNVQHDELQATKWQNVRGLPCCVCCATCPARPPDASDAEQQVRIGRLPLPRARPVLGPGSQAVACETAIPPQSQSHAGACMCDGERIDALAFHFHSSVNPR